MITDTNNRFRVIINFSVEIFVWRDKIGSVLPPGKGRGTLLFGPNGPFPLNRV